MWNILATWTAKYRDRIKAAEETLVVTDSVAKTLSQMIPLAQHNQYNLEIYGQVNKLIRFSNNALLLLKTYDQAKNEKERKAALAQLGTLRQKFNAIRSELESVYGKTRLLTKPNEYILDQDHHSHLANQTLSFDWQFYAELLFLENLEASILMGAQAIKS